MWEGEKKRQRAQWNYAPSDPRIQHDFFGVHVLQIDDSRDINVGLLYTRPPTWKKIGDRKKDSNVQITVENYCVRTWKVLAPLLTSTSGRNGVKTV